MQKPGKTRTFLPCQNPLIMLLYLYFITLCSSYKSQSNWFNRILLSIFKLSVKCSNYITNSGLGEKDLLLQPSILLFWARFQNCIWIKVYDIFESVYTYFIYLILWLIRKEKQSFSCYWETGKCSQPRRLKCVGKLIVTVKSWHLRFLLKNIPFRKRRCFFVN